MSRAGRAVPWRSRSAVFPHVFAHGQALSSFCVRQWLVMGAVIEKRLRRVKDRGSLLSGSFRRAVSQARDG